MKKLLAILLAATTISAGLGCTMCAHPNDYCYAVYDEAHAYGHRAGSAFSPVSYSSGETTESVLETVDTDAVYDEEYYEVGS
ncbi:hypothetical protein LOC68_05620 [Blastopirellula sp. JC732]|uniref:Lipoprotein n=1 Tax=Blastopirellula sediminis TaxID=2894196 RepID=A0A9X1SEH4_9BACT|nr:hypothetical protein [Blastopirellula sediminis]MCC9609358.1 hypothetical protein [Blastopirellula sediminis]MCC9627865.1 hypothetical protein [Blastopirellula sediminis]